MKSPSRLSALWEPLTSLKLTIACLALLMALVAACTLAQVPLGTYGAVKVYMRSLFVYWPLGSWNIPVFPGGGLVGLLLLVNLVASQFARLELSWPKSGLWAVHLGLILLFLGEFVTGLFQVETQMAIDEGATLNYSESARETELAVVDTTASGYDEVYSIPEPVLSRKKILSHLRLPFSLEIKRYYPNSSLRRLSENETALATAGIGTAIAVSEEPPAASEEQRNQVSTLIEIKDGERRLGTWLLSNALGAPQILSYQGRNFVLSLRAARHYLPFSLTLEKFRHDVYPGTDIPKNFSSLVRLVHPERGEDRDVLIYMNNPLRYGGKAFYQASFGKNDTMSVLQVVENPGWLLPYFSCALVALGLLLHFFMRLRAFKEELR